MVARKPPGRVSLVGAGPGAPELLTLRAVECLKRATLILYDQLVDPRVLEHAPHAKHVCVADAAGAHAGKHESSSQARRGEILERMIAAARAGETVVRLKGGDPGIFGRLGEEAQALADAEVPFEIVPGVSAGLAAGACAGIPLTHRAHASAVALVTGHECANKPGAALDWSALARFPGTLVVYMGLTKIRTIAQTLVEQGQPPDTPVAVIRWASTNRQTTAVGTLATIAGEVERLGLRPPAVIIVGPVVACRPSLQWFERRPLFGRSVLVTRPSDQAGETIRQLEELGALVYALPTVKIGPAPDPAGVEGLHKRLHEFDWLVFTSAAGVRAFVEQLLDYEARPPRDLRALGRLKLAAIGPRTAEALRDFSLAPDLVPAEFRSEGLLAALSPHVRGRRVLLARADRGRALLREELARICQVEEIAVYSQVDVEHADEAILDLLRRGKIDFVTLTSANIARAFVRLLDAESRQRLGAETRLVTISPVTSEAVRELGLEVAAEAVEFTSAGLIDALVRLAAPEA